MIYAELRREGGDDGYYTLRYLVWNGDNMVGTYGVNYRPDDTPYGASRDYHQLATEAQIAARKVWDDFQALPDAEQDAAYDADTAPDYPQMVDGCCYFDGKPTCCDGSSLVEIIDGDDKRCFEIAAMMANVKDREVPDYTDNDDIHDSFRPNDDGTVTYISPTGGEHTYDPDDL